jgi:GNAT superfamily N-acetyltransferase
MFEEMGRTLDKPALTAQFGAWLREVMPPGTYKAWLVEAPNSSVVAGGGMTIIPWPPGPTYPGDRLAFVYNVYTEPEHRNRGLARLVMHAMHGYCREHGISSLALNASQFGQPLYESLGYAVTPSPMMFLALE